MAGKLLLGGYLGSGNLGDDAVMLGFAHMAGLNGYEVTRQLRENNQRLSSRDFEGEVADIEAEIIVRRQRRSLLPPSK